MAGRMSATQYAIRDDLQYTVIVGWDDELESFFACVFDAATRSGEPVAVGGQEPHEITTVPQLEKLVERFASLDAGTASALRCDARTPSVTGRRE